MKKNPSNQPPQGMKATLGAFLGIARAMLLGGNPEGARQIYKELRLSGIPRRLLPNTPPKNQAQRRRARRARFAAGDRRAFYR